MEKQNDELLTLIECEALTKRKVATWRRDILERKIPYIKLGRQVRVQRSVVEAIIKKGLVGAVGIQA